MHTVLSDLTCSYITQLPQRYLAEQVSSVCIDGRRLSCRVLKRVDGQHRKMRFVTCSWVTCDMLVGHM